MLRHAVKTHLSDTDYEAFSRLAKAKGLSESALLRTLVSNAINSSFGMDNEAEHAETDPILGLKPHELVYRTYALIARESERVHQFIVESTDADTAKKINAEAGKVYKTMLEKYLIGGKK